MDNEKKFKQEEHNVDAYPGAAVNVADDESVDKTEVKKDVKKLNDNPRNNGKLV